jgi:hypothetical protein
MPQTERAALLREEATNFRRLAGEYSEAGKHHVSDKLIEIAVDFEGQTFKLATAPASEGLQRCIEAVDRIVTDLEALAAMTTQRG